MIRPYRPEDKQELLAILRLNMPQYFAPSEEQDYIDYLATEATDYFVVEEKGEIIGAGGINYFYQEALARISWDIIRPKYHGKGIGTALALYRIVEIKKKPAINFIVVRTSQFVYQFYQKLGFELDKIEKDFWAPGFDLYQMKQEL